MTEYSQSNAFTWANTMHDLISNYNVSAVDHGSGFNGLENELIVLKHNGRQYLGYERTKYYYVIGQYSRFVKPGSRRVKADSTNHAVRATAYKNGQNLVIVAINNLNTPKTVQFHLNGLSGIREVRPIRTSNTEIGQCLTPFTTADRLSRRPYPKLVSQHSSPTDSTTEVAVGSTFDVMM